MITMLWTRLRATFFAALAAHGSRAAVAEAGSRFRPDYTERARASSNRFHIDGYWV